jgi:hypothetical protein
MAAILPAEHHPAVEGHRLPGHPGGLVRNDVGDETGDLLGRQEAVHRDAGQQRGVGRHPVQSEPRGPPTQQVLEHP